MSLHVSVYAEIHVNVCVYLLIIQECVTINEIGIFLFVSGNYYPFTLAPVKK